MAISKSNNWMAILYPENMIDDWEKKIAQVLEMPCSYVLHDKDAHIDSLTNEVIDKPHIHLFLHYGGNTTGKHIKNVVNLLSKPGEVCCSTCQPVIYPQSAYDYMLHNTEQARQDNKFQYPETARHNINNFDIHFIAQDDAKQKSIIVRDLTDFIIASGFTNYIDFVFAVELEFEDDLYFLVQEQKHSYFNTLIKGNYNKMQYMKEEKEKDRIASQSI